ncbi:MAG TPA: sialidase family protein [Thermoanaerobaculia bacterium]|nr:sialidase family protein [Thermoanaerobaculia bacterium]
MITAPFLLAVLLATTTMQHGHGAAPQKGMRTPAVAFESRTKVWRVWTDEGHILAAVSTDGGKSWPAGTRITREAETIDANGESRPKLALGSKGEVYVSWTRSGKKSHSGDVRFSRSVDGGKTFDAPRTINDDGVERTHRFDTLAVAADGTVHLAWVDARDADAAKAAEKPYIGAALYHAVSRDRGATFAANRKIKDHICECCRIARTFDEDGNLVLLWRDAAGNLRDHVLIRLTPQGKVAGEPARATTDNWKINGCPHQGPSIAVGRDGVTHMVWFTGEGPNGPGAFYGRLDANGKAMGAPHRLTPLTMSRGVVEVQGSRVIVAWKESRTAGAAVMVSTSSDNGATFSAPRAVAETSGMSDHPLLVTSAGGVYLSWFAATEGHRLIAL